MIDYQYSLLDYARLWSHWYHTPWHTKSCRKQLTYYLWSCGLPWLLPQSLVAAFSWSVSWSSLSSISQSSEGSYFIPQLFGRKVPMKNLYDWGITFGFTSTILSTSVMRWAALSSVVQVLPSSDMASEALPYQPLVIEIVGEFLYFHSIFCCRI